VHAALLFTATFNSQVLIVAGRLLLLLSIRQPVHAC